MTDTGEKLSALKRILLLMTGAVILLLCFALAGCSAREAAGESPEPEEAAERTGESEETGENAMKQEDTLDIRFLKCGKADAIVLSCGGQTMVIDAGEEDDGEKLVSDLRAAGADHVDVLIITHFDKDHVGGAAKLIGNTEVKEIYTPSYVKPSDDYDNFSISDRFVEWMTVTAIK